MANIAQRVFGGGEIAEELYARTDTAKYQTALRKLVNFFIHRHGGLSNRAGTSHRREVKDSARTVRLVPFIFNDEQTYVLEFGHNYIRFFKDGDYLNYEIASPYVENDLMELRLTQSADVITITCHGYAPRELSRLADTNWTLEVIVFGPSIGMVANLTATGGTAGADDTIYAVTAVDAVTGEEGLPAYYTRIGFTPDGTNAITLTWDELSGAGSYRVYRSLNNGVSFELILSGRGVPVGKSDSTWTDSNESVTCITTDVWEAAAGQARNQVITAGVPGKAYNGVYTIYGTLTVDYNDLGGGTGTLSGRLRAFYKRDAETRVDVGIIASGGAFGGGSGWSENFIASINVPDNGYTDLVIDIVPEGYAWNPSVGDVLSVVGDFTVAGFDKITWSALGSGFIDEGQNGDPLQGVPVQRDVFNSPNRYPLANGIYQQRRCFADTEEEPETVYASRTGAYRNFNISSPLQDDDAVTFSMAGNRVNRVLHLLDLGRLLVFTSGNAMRVDGDESNILRPDAINPRKFSASGIGRLPPLEIVDSAVYVQARGRIVRDVKPLAATEGYESKDLTLFAAHLLKQYGIVDWAYAETPDSIVWAVRADGTLLGLTYMPEQDVFGWHRHTTNGLIERVCVVPEGERDAVYLVVKRTINGSDKRFVERMESRVVIDIEDSFFVDCGITRTGAPTTTVTGLAHLEGEDVSVLADGEVIANPNRTDLTPITVTGGQITLPSAKSLVHVGLPYKSDFETLDIDSVRSSVKGVAGIDVSNVLLMLANSAGGIFVGAAEPQGIDPLADLSELPLNAGELNTDAFEANIFTAWNNHGRIFVRQADPLPVTVLAAVPQGYF